MPGSSNITGLESIVFCDNLSLDGTERAGAISLDGELWIGSTSGRHVRKGTLTAGSGITITNGSGSITIAGSGGTITSVLTANATPQFNLVGSVETIDFKLTNLVLGSSLPSLSGATFNVGMGFNALNALTSGTTNIAIGYNSLLQTTSAVGNTAVGHNSLLHATTNGGNTAIGVSALTALIAAGINNTAVGATSLASLGTGSYNTVIGQTAGGNYTSSESSNILISNGGTAAESNVTRIGTQGSGVGQQNTCFIAGITGVSVSNLNVVTINTSTGQLGSQSGVLTDYHVARYIVSAGGATDGANYTTIGAALTAATSAGAPQTIYIQPGIYTENITLVAGINLCACSSDALGPSFASNIAANVIIKGTVTASFTGSVSCSGIQFKTNGAAAIASTGSNSGNLILTDCSVFANDSTGITLNNANLALTCYTCSFNNASANLLFAVTTGGSAFYACNFELIGGAAASTLAASTMAFYYCVITGLSITTSTTGSVNILGCYWVSGAVTLLTMVGTGTSSIYNSAMLSTSGTTITIGSGTTVNLTDTVISSSNASAISGAGTLNYKNLTFPNTSSNIPVTTSVPYQVSDITAATQTFSVNNTYVANRGGGVTFTLPASAGEGEWIEVVGKAGLWVIAQNALQSIRLGSSTTTVGVTGSLTAINAADCIRMVCTTSGSSTVWTVVSSMGNITVA